MFARRLRNVRVVCVLVCECAWRVCGAYARVRGSVFMCLCVLHAVHLWVRIRTLRYI